MKLSLKWMVLGTSLIVLGAGAFQTWQSRVQKKQLVESQQQAQKNRAALQLAPTDTVTAQSVVLSLGLPISGQTKAVSSAFVKARVAGELQDLQVREGDFVQAGQTIARVDSTEYAARLRQAQQQAQAAKAQVDIAQRSFDNNRALVDQGFISKTGLDASASNLAAAQASYMAAQSGVEVLQKVVDDAVLRSPIAGQVAQRLVQNGERVAIESRVIEIVDLRRLELEATVGVADAMQVRVGQSAQLNFEGAAQAVPAQVVRVNPSATPGTRSVTVYLALQGKAALRQGLYAQGLLATGELTALALPLSAVRTDKPLPYVQVLQAGKLAVTAVAPEPAQQMAGRTELRVVHKTVELGRQSAHEGATWVQVLKGLDAGDRILAGSTGGLREGTLVEASSPASVAVPGAKGADADRPGSP
jgi:RND family efflux transporter MFP subunit